MENVAVMIEEMTAQEWERMNMPTDSVTLQMAARSLGFAIQELDTAADSVNEAMETLADTPEGDRVGSILAEMENLLRQMKEYQTKWGRA